MKMIKILICVLTFRAGATSSISLSCPQSGHLTSSGQQWPLMLVAPLPTCVRACGACEERGCVHAGGDGGDGGGGVLLFVNKCVQRQVPLPPAALRALNSCHKSLSHRFRPAAAVQSGFPSAVSLWVQYLPFPTLCTHSLGLRRGQWKCVLLHITLATVFDLLLKRGGRRVRGGGGDGGRQPQPDHLAQPTRPWESPGETPWERHATFSTTSAHTQIVVRDYCGQGHNSGFWTACHAHRLHRWGTWSAWGWAGVRAGWHIL